MPNFEEIWPSEKSKAKEFNPNKGINYVLGAMMEGYGSSKDAKFTTVGKPKVINSGRERIVYFESR